MRRSVVAVSVMMLVVGAGGYVACGGDNSSTALGGDAGPDAEGLDSTTGSDSSGGGDSTTGGDSTGGGDSASGGDAGSDSPSEGAVGNGDASADAPSDVTLVPETGGPLTDASPGGDATTLNCGSVNCSLPNQACCIYPILSPPPPFYSACSSGSTCPALAPDSGYDAGTATELRCEVQANCPANNVCCLEAPSSGAIHAHCISGSSCVSTDGGLKVALICDPSLGDAGCGEAGACSSTNISTWSLPSGFGTCGGVAK
jgi:hypothetical protein